MLTEIINKASRICTYYYYSRKL